MPDIEAKAKEYGMDKTEFILSAVDLLMGMDPVWYYRLKAQAAGLQVPFPVYLQNELLRRLAEDDALTKAGQDPKAPGDFVHTASGIVTGKEFFDRVLREQLALIESDHFEAQHPITPPDDMKEWT
jgi:hypothetical protein